MNVDGETKIVGLFGYPVRHTASPAFHNAAFESLGLNWVYLPFEVEPGDLREAVEGVKALGLAGMNVTVPHKEMIRELLDDLSPEAEAIGAVNTVQITEGLLHGYNTDGIGFMWALREREPAGVKGRKVLVMGTGGAGRAVAVQSAIEGAGELLLCDMEEERAEIVAGHITDDLDFGPVKPVPFSERAIQESLQGVEVLVDATPLGMHEDDPTSVDADWLQKGMLVIDLVYRPAETPLLRGARERGCRTMNGLGMLLHQGAKAFEIWTGMDAPLDVMRSALETAVYGPKTD